MAVPLFTTELFCTVTEPLDVGTQILLLSSGPSGSPLESLMILCSHSSDTVERESMRCSGSLEALLNRRTLRSLSVAEKRDGQPRRGEQG